MVGVLLAIEETAAVSRRDRSPPAAAMLEQANLVPSCGVAKAINHFADGPNLAPPGL
jgi:hypothetical protein